jgi:hypothetical protein
VDLRLEPLSWPPPVPTPLRIVEGAKKGPAVDRSGSNDDASSEVERASDSPLRDGAWSAIDHASGDGWGHTLRMAFLVAVILLAGGAAELLARLVSR